MTHPGIELANRAIQEAARAMGPLAEYCLCGQPWDAHDKANCKPPGWRRPPYWRRVWDALRGH